MVWRLRWSFMGPFETIDLNAPAGIRDYVERYQSIYSNIFPQMQRRVDWAGEVMDEIEPARRALLPAADKLKEQAGLAGPALDGACRTQAARCRLKD